MKGRKIDNVMIEKLQERITPIEKLLEKKKVLEQQLTNVLSDIQEFLFHQKEKTPLEKEQLKEKAKNIINQMKEVEEKIRSKITDKENT